MLNKSANVN